MGGYKLGGGGKGNLILEVVVGRAGERRGGGGIKGNWKGAGGSDDI